MSFKSETKSLGGRLEEELTESDISQSRDLLSKSVVEEWWTSFVSSVEDGNLRGEETRRDESG